MFIQGDQRITTVVFNEIQDKVYIVKDCKKLVGHRRHNEVQEQEENSDRDNKSLNQVVRKKRE